MIIAVILTVYREELMDLYMTGGIPKNKSGMRDKIQLVRLFDVFVLGPLALYTAYRIIEKPPVPIELGYGMILYAIGTMYFNGNAWLYNYRAATENTNK